MLRRAAPAAVAALLCAAATAQAAPPLRAGAGRSDITPPTGYYAFGWVRGDDKLSGQHTRLFARAIVLQRGGEKVALVAADLGGVPGGGSPAAPWRRPRAATAAAASRSAT
jgi:neutral ceramidase